MDGPKALQVAKWYIEKHGGFTALHSRRSRFERLSKSKRRQALIEEQESYVSRLESTLAFYSSNVAKIQEESRLRLYFESILAEWSNDLAQMKERLARLIAEEEEHKACKKPRSK